MSFDAPSGQSSPVSPNYQQVLPLAPARSFSVRAQNSPFPATPTASSSNLQELLSGMAHHESIRSWTDAHVARWLTDIKCGTHAATFKANDIRGDVLLELDQTTLKEMGVSSIGDRLRIVNAIKALRHKCSSKSLSHSLNGKTHPNEDPEISTKSSHERSPSDASSRTGLPSRRLDAGRPAPLQLNYNKSKNLPRIVHDGPAPDSARLNPNIRPLPQPSQPSTGSSNLSSSTPTSNNSNQSNSSARSNHPHLPPPPHAQPPMPPPGRQPPRPSLNGSQLNGRRTPTQNDIPSYTSQPLPPAPSNQNLLTPGTANSTNWVGYGLPPDPRPGNLGGKAPVKTTSPLNLPSRTSSRHPSNSSAHTKNLSLSSPNSSTAVKLPVRPSPGNSTHPYATSQGPSLLSTAVQQAYNLSPIAESFLSHHSSSGSPSPPTHAIGGRSAFNRPNTPSHHNVPSLDDLRRKLVKFLLPEERHSCTINVEDCADGVEVLEKALKKFGKIGPRSSDSDNADHIQTSEGGLAVDGWAVYLDNAQGDGPDEALTERELMSICQAPPDHPWREHGLTLRRTGKTKRSKALVQIFGEPPPSMPGQRGSPTSPENNLLSPSHSKFTDSLLGKSTKRASSISILSGLGVRDPEKALDPVSPTTPNTKVPASPVIKRPSKLRNFFGQRPPSELITTHLTEYFPFTEKKVLERTARHSMMRNSTLSSGRRDSAMSFIPPLPSRFSNSTQGSLPRLSTSSTSTSSSSNAPAVPEKPSVYYPESAPPQDEIPRVSLSTQDGRSIDLNADSPGSDSASRLLPPVSLPSQSLSDSMEDQLGMGQTPTAPNASKRLSFITELRSKRDRSDTASLMTVDQITAEVESRRESLDVDRESDDWTKVDPENGDIDDLETEDDVPNEMFDEEEEPLTDNDEECGQAETKKATKWIRGALIGAGSFGKVYLGMDASNGLLMAVKQVELPTGSAPNQERKKSMLRALEREIELLKDLQHENIVQYLYSSLEDDFLNIFLEYVPGGSVTALLSNYGAFEEPLVKNFVRQILAGLNYLHERDIIHRDIKGANILVDNKGGVKISDFGISKKVEDSLLTRMHRPSLQGSVFWMAPEVVKQSGHTRKADIWSLGCLVVEMLTGEHPWAQLTQMQAIYKIGSYAKPSIPSDISAEAQDFLRRTFEVNHQDRPDAGGLLQHPWVAKKPAHSSHKGHFAKANNVAVEAAA